MPLSRWVITLGVSAVVVSAPLTAAVSAVAGASVEPEVYGRSAGAGAGERGPEVPGSGVVSDGAEGWLILDGELIAGPYEVVTSEEGVFVNGRAVHRPSAGAEAVPAETGGSETHDLLVSFRGAYRTWYEELGPEAARTMALEFMSAQPIVDHARLESDTSLSVRFRGRQHDERVSLLAPPAEDVPCEATQRQFATDLGASLEYWLSSGCLVVLQQGAGFVTPPLEGAAALARMREILATETDFEARVEAVRGVIPDSKMARAIVERMEGA